MNNNAFGYHLRRLRQSESLTIRDLHRLSGVAVSDICRLENGVYAPKIKTLIRLSDGLNVSKQRMLHMAGVTDVTSDGLKTAERLSQLNKRDLRLVNNLITKLHRTHFLAWS